MLGMRTFYFAPEKGMKAKNAGKIEQNWGWKPLGQEWTLGPFILKSHSLALGSGPGREPSACSPPPPPGNCSRARAHVPFCGPPASDWWAQGSQAQPPRLNLRQFCKVVPTSARPIWSARPC